jgi:small subunit ribosomal protein S6
MADTATTYDLSLLLDAELPEDQRSKVVSEVERAIQGSGTLIGRHDWGLRRMAYEIEHRADADYHLLQFQGPAELIEALQRSLRISDAVVRFRIIKLPPGAPPPPEVRPDPRVVEAPRPAAEAPPVGEVVADEAPAEALAESLAETLAEEGAEPPAEAPAEAPAAEETAPAETAAAEETSPVEAAAPEAAAEETAPPADDASAEQPAEGAPSSA